MDDGRVVDDRKSRAVTIYVCKDISPFPWADPDGVVRAFPEDGRELVTYAEDILREMRSLPVGWATETYDDAIQRVKDVMQRRHPELSEEAADSIGWVFSYDWK